MTEYDNKYLTLVDYFCIIGASTKEIEGAIENAKNGQTTILDPVILSRCPEIDKPSIAFPNQVTEFCLPERITTLKANEIKNLNPYKPSETVLTSSDGQSIYVVGVSFYEDLALIEEQLAEKRLKEYVLQVNKSNHIGSETASHSSESSEGGIKIKLG